MKTKAATFGGILDKALALYRAKESSDVRAYTELSDEDLVKLAQNGEEEAYSQIISRYQGKIYAYIMRLTNHRDEAYDVTQDVFMKAFRHLHRFDTERKFSSWLYRIAHNESVNWLKKKTRTKIDSLDSRVENGFQLPDKTNIFAELVKDQDIQSVRSAIDALPERYREVMELRYVKEASYDEIATQLNKPVNTVGTLINRAKKKLSLQLEQSSP